MRVPVPSAHTDPPPTSVGGVDLTEAFRLLRQAGYPDLRIEANDVPRLLQRVIDALCELSLRDGLTGLANARSFRLVLEREIERAIRTGEPYALLMLDMDHFKSINDTYGHQAGDVVLQTVARRLTENVRPMDTVARYGGEEFSVILPNSLSAYAMQVAERLRIKVAQETVPMLNGTSLRVTISVGVANAFPWSHLQADQLIAAADRNLYLAKAQGRNRVCGPIVPASTVTGDERAALFAQPSEKG